MKTLRTLFALLALAPSLRAAPVEVVPPEFQGALQPQVALSPSGRVHVVFGRDNAIYHTSSADGRGFSPPVKIGELEKLALRMRRGPRVTATEAVVLVTAISHADGNVHSWTSADGGKTWKEGAVLNSAARSAREGLQALAGNGRGLVGAVWLDHRGAGMEVRGRFSRDGGLTWGEDTAVYQSPDGHVCECCVPNVAVGARGEVAVMWRNWLGGSRDLWLAASTDGGRTFGAAQKLGTGTWKLQGCPMDGGSLAFSPEGNWLAVWRRESAVYASDKATPERRLAAGGAQSVAGFAGKTPILVWEDHGALVLQRGDAPRVPFASAATAASLASGPESAALVWESAAGGRRTILFEAVR